MTNASEKTPDCLEQEIKETLQNLRRIERLQVSALLNSPLVQQQRQQNEQLTSYEALRAVFDDLLLELQETNREYADLLRGRYWQGHQVKKMVADERPAPWSESSFYNHQQRALQQFSLIFKEREALVTQQANPLTTSETFASAAQAMHVTDEAPYHEQSSPVSVDRPKPCAFSAPALIIQHPYLISLLLFTLVSIPIAWLMLNYRLQSNSTTGSTLPVTELPISACGEGLRFETPPAVQPRFLASQGVSLFTVENTPGGILSNFVRTVEFGPTGLWIGYHAAQAKMTNRGVSHFNKKTWAACNENAGPYGKNINDIAVDQNGQIWVTAEQTGGVQMFDGQQWHTFTIADGLLSNDTFGITIDQENHIWIGTYEGVAKYDGRKWTAPYTRENGALFSNHVHTIAFDNAGGIWVGHHDAGISYLAANSNTWVHITTQDGLSSDRVYRILVSPSHGLEPESIWVATEGGLNEFRNQQWISFASQNKLLSSRVNDLALDKYNRLWVATDGGVTYWDDQEWHVYHTLPSVSIAFGPPNCSDCPYDDEHVVTGTFEHGFTHSRVPYPTTAVDIEQVCGVVNNQEEKLCGELQKLTPYHYQMDYPNVLHSNDQLRLEITVRPFAPYQLQEVRGDFLANLVDSEEDRFGAYQLMPVKGIVEAGQSFTFTSYDDPLIMPTISNSEPITITSSWRIWMHTRYTGPVIDLNFSVQADIQQSE